MIKLSIRTGALVVVALSLPSPAGALPAGLREAGLYTADEGSETTVRNFLAYFSFEAINQSRTAYWTTANNAWPTGVDAHDLVYYTGHGCAPGGGNYAWYGITSASGNCINLLEAGNNSNRGYGARLKYLVLHSCETVASPWDDPDSATKWLQEPGSIFDGLHILLGFRTQTDRNNGLNIASEMGYLTATQSSLLVWDWQNAIDAYGDPVDPWMDQYSIYTAYLPGHFFEAAYSSFWDVYGGSQSAGYDSPNLYAMWSQPE